MATESFTKTIKFSNKDAKNLVNALEKSKKAKTHKNLKYKRLTNNEIKKKCLIKSRWN